MFIQHALRSISALLSLMLLGFVAVSPMDNGGTRITAIDAGIGGGSGHTTGTAHCFNVLDQRDYIPVIISCPLTTAVVAFASRVQFSSKCVII